jgi:hypothetical protein
MNCLQNSASQRSNISASSSSKGKLQSQTKPQGPHATMTASVAILSRYTASTQMAVGHQRIGRRILGHLRKKETREPPIQDLPSTIKEAAHQIIVMATTEAHTHSDLRTACSTIVKPTIAQKIAPYFSSPKEKWTKNSTSLRSKWHTEKSTTLCNELSTTSNILHLTLHTSHYKPTKTAKPNPWLTINHTTMPQLTIHNLRQLHK